MAISTQYPLTAWHCVQLQVDFRMTFNPHNLTVGANGSHSAQHPHGDECPVPTDGVALCALQVGAASPWLVSNSGTPVAPTSHNETASACPHCVEWEGKLELQVVQRMDYYFFPFGMTYDTAAIAFGS
jgi:hypothetical protein